MGTQTKNKKLYSDNAKVMELDPNELLISWRARRDFGDIASLANDILENGQIEPIAVSRVDQGWLVVAGLRRTKACASVGVLVKAVEIHTQDSAHLLQVQFSENFARKNFSLLEVGEAIKKLQAVYKKTNQEDKSSASFIKAASEQLGCSPSTIRDMLKIAEMPAIVKQKISTAGSTKQQNKVARKELAAKRKSDKRKKQKEKISTILEHRKTNPDEYKYFLYNESYKKMLRRLPQKFFDLILTDPPFELCWSEVSHDTRKDINESLYWDRLDLSWVDDVVPYMQDDASVLAFCSAELIGAYKQKFESAGLKWRGHIAWHKSNPCPVHRNVYASSMEYIVWASKGSPYFEAWENAGTIECHNFKQYPTCSGNIRNHPTQKPIELLEEFVQRHSFPKARVFDPFGGSFSIVAACLKHNRECYSTEIDNEYFEDGKILVATILSELIDA